MTLSAFFTVTSPHHTHPSAPSKSLLKRAELEKPAADSLSLLCNSTQHVQAWPLTYHYTGRDRGPEGSPGGVGKQSLTVAFYLFKETHGQVYDTNYLAGKNVYTNLQNTPSSIKHTMLTLNIRLLLVYKSIILYRIFQKQGREGKWGNTSLIWLVGIKVFIVHANTFLNV